MLVIAICGIFLALFLRRGKTQPSEAVKQEIALEGLH